MSCKIVRDLLPLYYDEVVSEESRVFVEEHLESCAECKKILEDLHESAAQNNTPETEQPMVSSFRVIKKKLHRKAVIVAAISIICAVAIAAAVTYVVFFYETPVPYRVAARDIKQPITSALDVFTDLGWHKTTSSRIIGDSLYVCCSDTLWSRYIVKPKGPQIYFSAVSSEPIDPIEPIDPVEPIDPAEPFDPGTSAKYGNPGLPKPFWPPEPPEPPEPPNPLILISGLSKVYYFEGRLSAFALDDAVFSRIAAGSVLIWEKP